MTARLSSLVAYWRIRAARRRAGRVDGSITGVINTQPDSLRKNGKQRLLWTVAAPETGTGPDREPRVDAPATHKRAIGPRRPPSRSGLAPARAALRTWLERTGAGTPMVRSVLTISGLTQVTNVRVIPPG